MSIKAWELINVYSNEKKTGEIAIEEVNDVKFATLYKSVDIATGKLKVPSGWATDQTHISELMLVAADWDIDPDNARILLTEKSDNRQWLTTAGKFIKHGFHIDRGFGSQYALVDEHWDELLGDTNESWTAGPRVANETKLPDRQLGLDLK